MHYQTNLAVWHCGNMLSIQSMKQLLLVLLGLLKITCICGGKALECFHCARDDKRKHIFSYKVYVYDEHNS